MLRRRRRQARSEVLGHESPPGESLEYTRVSQGETGVAGEDATEYTSVEKEAGDSGAGDTCDMNEDWSGDTGSGEDGGLIGDAPGDIDPEEEAEEAE
jgi:hypothetical protein